jgi:sugar/nucleoside kinase (ribokinase family)
MLDIIYIGNCSIDNIATANRAESSVFGGSALNSSLACRAISDLRIGIISAIGDDFDLSCLGDDIAFYGQKYSGSSNVFHIDESRGACSLSSGEYLKIDCSKKIHTKHLHISFRKGVDVDRILSMSEITYETLSIDVMIHSMDSAIKSIQKYGKKIDTLFCNKNEYAYIQEHIKYISKIVITNEERPVISIVDGRVTIYPVQQIAEKMFVSSTGAGDSFIGGFLGRYISRHSVDEAVFAGIAVANESLRYFGNLHLSKKRIAQRFQTLKRRNCLLKMPTNIIVIGAACSGKTTLIKAITSLCGIYKNVDDLAALQEVFLLDDMLSEGRIEEFIKFQNKLIFSRDIWDEYNRDLKKHDRYTSKAMNRGHNIERPILWDKILQSTVAQANSQNIIIEFSRGYDAGYQKEVSNDVYQRSIGIILKSLPVKSDPNVLAINIHASFGLRKKRNSYRFLQGGHYVADETMNTVYKKDVYIGDAVSRRVSIIDITNNRQLESGMKDNSFLDMAAKVIKKYNLHLKEKNELEETSKRNLSEQDRERIQHDRH